MTYSLESYIDAEYSLEFGVIDHETDPETGQTRLFEGGFFNSTGVFTGTGAWDS